MRRAVITFLALVPACGLAADGSALNCNKAEGEVQQLICGNPDLAALDGKLNEVFRAALSKARKAKDELRTEQQGWTKERDDCSKAGNSMEACLRRSYQERIGELQARHELVPAKGPYTFVCGATADDEVIVKYFHTEPPSARLERGGRTVVAWSQPAASGARFVGKDVTFLNKGTAAQVEWFGAKLSCEVRAAPPAR